MKAIGIILAGGNSDRLGLLTALRATSAMPVGGSYRAIDFSLSSMTNSGINKVAVITQYNSRSLHDHLTSSKWWDFGRKIGGLFVFSPYASGSNPIWSRGTAESLFQNISYLKRSNEPYVIIAPGDCVYKMDFQKMLHYHIQKEADVTIACQDMEGKNLCNYGIMKLNEEYKMLDFEEKPLEPMSSIASLGIYIISRTLLMKMLETLIPQGRYDLVKDLFYRYRKKLNIYGYFHDGYWSNIGAIEDFYSTNMDFLNKDIRDLFLKQEPYVETKAKDEPPVKYNSNAIVKNSIVGSGSILNGKIENSVLFRRVYTGDNSVTENSIILESSYIGNNCIVKNAILDKEVILSDGKQIIGTPENPAIIGKNTVV